MVKTASNEVDHLARQRFGKGSRKPNKIEVFGLIVELHGIYDGSSHTASNNNRRNGAAYRRDGQRKAARSRLSSIRLSRLYYRS